MVDPVVDPVDEPVDEPSVESAGEAVGESVTDASVVAARPREEAWPAGGHDVREPSPFPAAVSAGPVGGENRSVPTAAGGPAGRPAARWVAADEPVAPSARSGSSGPTSSPSGEVSR